MPNSVCLYVVMQKAIDSIPAMKMKASSDPVFFATKMRAQRRARMARQAATVKMTVTTYSTACDVCPEMEEI